MPRTRTRSRRPARGLPREIWVLHGDPALPGRLGALSGHVQAMGDWSSLGEAFAAAAPSAELVVVDPYLEAAESGPSPRLAGFLRDFPSAVVVAAVPSASGRSADLAALGDWGVSGFLTLDWDTSEFALRRRLEEARERSALYAVLQEFPDALSADARTLVECALAAASRGGGVQLMAEAMHLTERTLQRRLERAQMPPPRTLLRWMRLLLAARLLDDPGRTVVSAALASGYASDASLHRNFRISGLPSPATLRRDGALRGAIGHFLQALESYRR